jgi:hypothetical protein
LLYRPHIIRRKGQQLSIVFRDRELSDVIGFAYSQWNPNLAVTDFLNRLDNIHQQFRTSQEPALVSIILDGENAWESYPDDGHEFLIGLYGALAQDERFRCVTVSEFLQQHPLDRTESLPELFSGSWIDGNFATWIGHPEKNAAWSLLAAARDALGEDGLAGDDAVALEHQLGLGAQARAHRGGAGEQLRRQRPAPLHCLAGPGTVASKAPASPLARFSGAQTRGAQWREGVVGHYAGPGEVPEGGVEVLRGVLGVGEQVEPEARPDDEPLADPVVDLALRRLDLDVGRRRTREPHVLPEIQRDATPAAERAGADPDELAAGAELIQPGGAVGAEAARQHVALPDLRRQRDTLQRHERLAQAVGAGADGTGRAFNRAIAFSCLTLRSIFVPSVSLDQPALKKFRTISKSAIYEKPLVVNSE